jgi:proton-coupled amino acid transporter
MLYETLDKFLSLVGSMTCAPIAFILPPAFHLKIVAETKREKVFDILLISCGFGIMIFTSVYTLMTW